MSVHVRFECDGCSAKVDGTRSLRPLIVPIDRVAPFTSGSLAHKQGPQDVAPEGWVAHDPWIYCTYCPECWAKVLAPDAADAKAGQS